MGDFEGEMVKQAIIICCTKNCVLNLDHPHHWLLFSIRIEFCYEFLREMILLLCNTLKSSSKWSIHLKELRSQFLTGGKILWRYHQTRGQISRKASSGSQMEQCLDMLTWQWAGGEAAGEQHHWLQCLTLITFLWKCCNFYSTLVEENCQILLDVHLHFI